MQGKLSLLLLSYLKAEHTFSFHWRQSCQPRDGPRGICKQTLATKFPDVYFSSQFAALRSLNFLSLSCHFSPQLLFFVEDAVETVVLGHLEKWKVTFHWGFSHMLCTAWVNKLFSSCWPSCYRSPAENLRRVKFCPPYFLTPHMEQAGMSHSLWILKMGSWDKKPGKGKSSYPSQLSQVSLQFLSKKGRWNFPLSLPLQMFFQRITCKL